MHPLDALSPLQHEWSSPSRPARVVVLGARGFVGGNFVDHLRICNIPCRPVSSNEMDLSGPESVRRLGGIIQPDDAIVFAAALTPEHGRDRSTFLKNVAMADHVCAALAETGCAHFVYISSDSVYSSASSELDELSFCESADLYALSHIVREKLLLHACAGRTPLTIVRPTAIYGARDTHNAYGPNRFLRSAVRDGKIVLFGQGEELRDHIYIDDVVRILELCLHRRSRGILNAANGTAVSFQEIAEIIQRAVNRPVALESSERRVPVIHRRFHIQNLRAAFPEFKPTRLESGVERFLDDLTRLERQDRASAITP